MAGPEGFDASLIETEALLKKMKPRPANLSAARIVYEAGRAVGKEEMQAQLVGGGMVVSALPATASWKKWVIPAWAGGATAVCLLLVFQFGFRGSREPTTPEYVIRGASHLAPSPGAPNFSSPGYSGVPPKSAAESYQPQPDRNTIIDQFAEQQTVPAPAPQRGTATAASNSDNQSGSIREGRQNGEPKKREKNLAEYIRDQLPSLESRRNLEPIEIKDGILQPPGPGGPMALTTLGFIKTP